MFQGVKPKVYPLNIKIRGADIRGLTVLCFYKITLLSLLLLNKNSQTQPEKNRFILDKNLAAQNIEISCFCCMTNIFILFNREFCTKVTFNAIMLYLKKANMTRAIRVRICNRNINTNLHIN